MKYLELARKKRKSNTTGSSFASTGAWACINEWMHLFISIIMEYYDEIFRIGEKEMKI